MVELFDHELEKVLGNIADINADPKAPREITLKIKPDEDRSFGPVEIYCTSRLAPLSKVTSRIFFARGGGKNFAVEHDPTQERFDFNQRADVKPFSAVPKQG